MKAIALATGVAFAAHASVVVAAPGTGTPQGHTNSGNPKAAGGPQTPGVGNPFNAY